MPLATLNHTHKTQAICFFFGDVQIILLSFFLSILLCKSCKKCLSFPLQVFRAPWFIWCYFQILLAQKSKHLASMQLCHLRFIYIHFTPWLGTDYYSGAQKNVYKYCFMKQKCQLQMGIVQYKNAATPLRTPCINTTHQHFKVRYMTLFQLKGAQKLSAIQFWMCSFHSKTDFTFLL